MRTSEVADKIRLIMHTERMREAAIWEEPIPWGGLSFHTQDRWKKTANAAGVVLGVTFEED